MRRQQVAGSMSAVSGATYAVVVLGCLVAVSVALLGWLAGPGPEVESLRSEHSRTFRGSDGTLTARIYGAPVNFRDAAGAWQAIDSRLQAVGDQLVNRANAYRLELPKTLSAKPVRVTDGERWVSFALQGAAPVAAVVNGAKATFPSALPGRDGRVRGAGRPGQGDAHVGVAGGGELVHVRG